jgi:hypothetical protein
MRLPTSDGRCHTGARVCGARQPAADARETARRVPAIDSPHCTVSLLSRHSAVACVQTTESLISAPRHATCMHTRVLPSVLDRDCCHSNLLRGVARLVAVDTRQSVTALHTRAFDGDCVSGVESPLYNEVSDSMCAFAFTPLSADALRHCSASFAWLRKVKPKLARCVSVPTRIGMYSVYPHE